MTDENRPIDYTTFFVENDLPIAMKKFLGYLAGYSVYVYPYSLRDTVAIKESSKIIVLQFHVQSILRCLEPTEANVRRQRCFSRPAITENVALISIEDDKGTPIIRIKCQVLVRPLCTLLVDVPNRFSIIASSAMNIPKGVRANRWK